MGAEVKKEGEDGVAFYTHEGGGVGALQRSTGLDCIVVKYDEGGYHHNDLHVQMYDERTQVREQ